MEERFGTAPAGVAYTDRRCAYAVIADVAGNITLVRDRIAYFLPGGGAHDGESPELTVRREVREECGRRVALGDVLGEAIEFFQAGETPYRMHATFLTGEFQSEVISPPEHELSWHWPEDAAGLVLHRSHAWAIRRSRGGSRGQAPGGSSNT